MVKNKDIAKLFKLTADLMELHGENPFKIKSYANAAFRIDKYDSNISELSANEIEKIEGIGKSLAQKINEIKETGLNSDLKILLDKTPPGLIDMLTIKGIGAKKIAVIWKTLEIESVPELLYACNENRLVEVKGFGAKTQQMIIDAISFNASNAGKFHYALLESIAINVINDLKLSGINPLMFTGKLRRKLEVLDKIEFISIKSNKEKLIHFFENYPDVENPDKIKDNKDALDIILHNNIPLHIYLSEESSYIKNLFLTTGSDEHLQFFSEIPASPASEIEIYTHHKMDFIEPEMREGLFEIELARNCNLPKLILPEDLKGVLHNHSKYSDGLHSLKEMAVYCKEQGFQYLGICDHSQSAFYANGLKPERVFEQHREIEKLNHELSPFKIFKGIESDILNDGSLDYENDVLSQFDFVVASVHSNLKMNEDKANLRLLKAIENPYTTILGHPTGRLLLAREGYPIDHKKIIDACAMNQVIIELNAHPYRLDLDWRWIRYAIDKGVMISINPDAHQMKGIHDMYYGVCVARKAGVAKKNVFNTLDINDISLYFKNRKKSISVNI